MNRTISSITNEVVISYLVPSYNHDKYLIHLLESIALDIIKLNVGAEILILDDGSTDNSTLIIENWAKKNTSILNIKYIFQENKGVCFTLNQLIKRASGKYIRVCASDDVIIEGSTQLLLDELIGNSELICVIGDGKIIDAEGRITHDSSIKYHGGSTKRLKNKNYLPQEIIQHWCIAGPSLLIKREYYDKTKYDENLIQEDFDLFLSLLRISNSISFIDKAVCLYRIHHTNTSKTRDNKKRIINHQSFLKTVEKYMSNDKLSIYLLPVKYKTKAKIYYLEKKYFKSVCNLMTNLFLRFK